jgi:ketosteroid isomerase-like protein
MRRSAPIRLCARFSAALLVASTTLANSAGAQGTSRSAAPSVPTASLPPALDKVLRDYEAAWRKGDAAALAALFAEDGFVLQTGRAPIRGRAAITSAYTGQGGSPLVLHALAGSVADTVGYIIGTYDYGTAGPEQGKFTLTLRRRAGGPWLIFSDMDNSTRVPE